MDTLNLIEHQPARPLIAITGKAGAGKTEAAQWLEQKHGYLNVKFATPLKNMLMVLLFSAGVANEQNVMDYIEGDLKETPIDAFGGATFRYMMQTLGTEWGRDCIGKDIWINTFEGNIKSTKLPVVNDDIRFENEASMIRRNGGRIIHLYRTMLVRDAGDHSSEEGLQVWPQDIVIYNNGTIKELQDRLDAVV